MHTEGIKEEEQLCINDQLMERIANGDEEAFTTLYTLSSKAVYSYILAIVRLQDLAQDLTQDTYIAIRQNIGKYQSCNKPMAWIFRIARNNAYSYFRKEKSTSEFNDELLYDSTKFKNDNSCLDSIVLETALLKLNEKERTVIILNAINGYKFKEIALYLEIPLGTVLASYHRGIRKLNKLLKEIIE